MADRSTPEGADRILTVPNAFSALRILTIPVIVSWILDPERSFVGLLSLGVVLCTDWVDGWLARRTGQVSEFGKLLDPVADRLAIAAGLVALVAVDAFPLPAAIAILGRDALMLVAGLVLLSRHRLRIDVRRVGKIATVSLMLAIGGISWSGLDGPLPEAFAVFGWSCFAVGIAEYYVATFVYVRDARAALGQRS